MSRGTAPALAGGRLSRAADRQFKYLAITPAVVVILLIGLFPIVYSAVVSFQNINMLEEDTSFSGLLNYPACSPTPASGRRSATPSSSSPSPCRSS